MSSPVPSPADPDRFRALIERSGEAALVLDDEAVVRYANPAAGRVFGVAPADLCGRTGFDLAEPSDVPVLRDRFRELLGEPGGVLRVDVRIRHADGSWRMIEATSTNLLHVPSVAAVLVWCRDVTDRRRADLRMAALDRTRRVLTDIHHTSVRLHDRGALLEAACRIAVEAGGFRMAWIGLLDLRTRQLEPVASAGATGDYLDRLDIVLDDRPSGRGPAARAARSGTRVVCNDIEHDPSMAPSRDHARRVGYGSMAAFPLKAFGATRGVFCLYTPEPAFFDDQEMVLLDELASDLSFALEFLDHESERERAEAALRESESWLRALFEQAAVGVAQVELDTGRFVRVNQKFCEIVGYAADDLRVAHPSVLVHPDDRDRAAAQVERLRTEEASEVTLEQRCLRRDGVTAWVSVTASRLAGTGGGVRHVVVVAQDITGRKLAESQLAQVREHLHQVQKLDSIGRLAGGIAHDLNNVLMPIVGYTQLLMAEFPPPSQIHADLQEVYRAAERASGLVRQILAFSRKQVLRLEQLDLNAVVTEFSSMLKRLIGEHIELHLVLAGDLPPITADRSQLEQVVLNLAVNARDAMPRGGSLLIETAADEGQDLTTGLPSPAQERPSVRLRVRDTGEGMNSETLDRVFEPFFTTKAVGQGTGLGLATVFGIVKQHEGHIRAESTPGEGTTFTLWFPASPARVVPGRTQPPRGPRALRRIATVLVVDDDPSVRHFVTVALRSHGLEVLEADGAVAALAIADRGDPIDLLLTDIVMPGLNGHDLFLELVRHRGRPDLRVLFMSGYTDDVIADLGIVEAGITLLEKPFTVEALLAQVHEAIVPPAGEDRPPI